jgi:hypothetical protein
MATQDQQRRLAGRAMLEAAFLQAFLNDPAGEARKMGITLTQTEVDQIKSLDKLQLAQLQQSFQNIVFGGHGGPQWE